MLRRFPRSKPEFGIVIISQFLGCHDCGSASIYRPNQPSTSIKPLWLVRGLAKEFNKCTLQIVNHLSYLFDVPTKPPAEGTTIGCTTSEFRVQHCEFGLGVVEPRGRKTPIA